MSTRKKIIIGGLGALTPVIMNLLIIDLNVLLVNLTLLAFLGYAIRVVIMFYLGGLVAFLHKDENSPIKLFELGIVAPALITALLNAGHVEVPKVSTQTSETPTASIFFIPSAYAQTPQEEEIEIKRFSLLIETSTEQFWRGLTGSSYKKVWFVIVGSHLNLEDAKRQVRQIAQERKDFKAEVYAPYDDDQDYSVVIGANLTYRRARLLRYKAIKAGFPKDTHLWTFPIKK